MLRILKYNSYIQIALIFTFFFFVVVVCSMFLGYQSMGGYLAPSILLLLTWLLYKKEGKNLSALGLYPNIRNILLLPLGIMIGILLISLALFAQMLNEEINIRLNPRVSYMNAFTGFFFLLQGVLNEELIFRGYCLDKTMKRMGIIKANLLFAFLFMVWHWFAWNAWGDWGTMLGAITTAFGHFLFATALLSSGSLFFPIGIHWGCNWASFYLFSLRSGSSATHTIFLVSSPETDKSLLHNFINIFITLVCFAIAIGVIWKLRRKNDLITRRKLA